MPWEWQHHPMEFIPNKLRKNMHSNIYLQDLGCNAALPKQKCFRVNDHDHNGHYITHAMV
jgi:hypothetical protein